MELSWWPVGVAGLLCLAIGVTAAALLPTAGTNSPRRPLAHVDRLTRLPEYVRAVRRQFWSTLAIVVLLVMVYTAAVLAGSRPVGPSATSGRVGAEDIMLCVGQPVTDPTTAGFLNYFANGTTTFDTQRIGLTSTSLRVVPLTRDYQYAADQFSAYAKVAGLQQQVDRQQPTTAGQSNELRTGIGAFSRPLEYVDYERNIDDVLALCLAGYPSSDDNAARRRSMIYLGNSIIGEPNDQRPSLFSAQRVTEMAAAAGVQINVITGSEAPDLRGLATGTGGTFQVYKPGGAGVDTAVRTDPALAAVLDRIRANPPRGVGAEGHPVAQPSADFPDVPLILGVVVSVLLCISVAVLRR